MSWKRRRFRWAAALYLSARYAQQLSDARFFSREGRGVVLLGMNALQDVLQAFFSALIRLVMVFSRSRALMVKSERSLKSRRL